MSNVFWVYYDDSDYGYPCDRKETEEILDGPYDPVEKPEHYNYHSDDGIECIDYIRQVLGKEGFIAYCRGNAIKYQHRAGYKDDTTQDMKKALWYQQKALEAKTDDDEG